MSEQLRMSAYLHMNNTSLSGQRFFVFNYLLNEI